MRQWTWAVLIVSAFWVFYTALFSQTILFYDSLGYQHLGKELAQGHFFQYFHTLNREPIYPLFVAVNMRLADLIHIPHTDLILLTQGIILLITQWLLAFVLQKIGVSDKITAALILYFIISPSMLRSSLVIYSEIIIYPLIIAAVVVSCGAWDWLKNCADDPRSYLRRGVCTGLVFIPLVFVKGIFEVITPLFLLILVCAAVFRAQMNHQIIKPAIAFFMIAFTVFYLPVLMYKTVNKICNDNFAFTNRGSWALYGTAARRVLPTTDQKRLAQKLCVFPDKSLCHQWAGPEACEHWNYVLSDNLGLGEYSKLRQEHLTQSEIDRRLMRKALDLMITHPWATVQGMFWEGAKLIFWEYPSWGAVTLPREISRVYEWPRVFGAISFVVNLLNCILIPVALIYLVLRRPYPKQEVDTYIFVVLLLVFTYILTHSLFFLNERNALPIVPLYFILAGAVIRVWAYPRW